MPGQLLLLGAGTASGGAVGSLDAYTSGLTAAYSASRQLLSAYGGAFYSASAGAIGTWFDQSGNSRNWTQTTEGFKPIEGSGGPSSRAWLEFDGVNDEMGSTATLADIINNDSGWIVVSLIVDAVSTNLATIWQNTCIIRDASIDVGLYLKSAPAVHAHNDDGTTDDGGAKAFSTATACVMTWRHEGGNIYSGVNDSETAGVASGNTATLTGTMRLSEGGAPPFDGKIFELLIYDTVPSSGDRTAIINILKNWCGA